jgi:hypothetical protein
MLPEAFSAAFLTAAAAAAPFLPCFCSSLAKECFKGLALVLPEAFSDEQLAALWSAQLRYQQLGHVMLDPNPLLADSYSVFLKEVRAVAAAAVAGVLGFSSSF